MFVDLRAVAGPSCLAPLGHFGAVYDSQPLARQASFDGPHSIASPLSGASSSAHQCVVPLLLVAGRLVSARSAEHTADLQSLMRNSYAVFCWTKKHMQHTS